MQINQIQYNKIKHILPTQRGNVTIDNIDFINALLYICENGCKWRRLPIKYGKWHVIYKRFHYWVDKGYIDRLFRELHVQDILSINPEALFLDSTTIKAHPDASGALKKEESNP
jgi:transposase